MTYHFVPVLMLELALVGHAFSWKKVFVPSLTLVGAFVVYQWLKYAVSYARGCGSNASSRLLCRLPQRKPWKFTPLAGATQNSAVPEDGVEAGEPVSPRDLCVTKRPPRVGDRNLQDSEAHAGELGDQLNLHLKASGD